MNEKLLQFIWQFQYFNKSELVCQDKSHLQIIFQGTINYNQGPDFQNASIKVDDTTLVGNIEIHVLASDFTKHRHQNDLNFNNLILHVVWKNDQTIFDKNNNPLPTLELQNRVPKLLLQKYEALMNATDLLPCSSFLPALSNIGWLAWKESLLAKRLETKALNVLNVFAKNNNNWEESFWQLLVYNFGLKVNADFFQNVADTISINILTKHKNNIHQLEALLLGQANLLEDEFTDQYSLMLQKEYLFLQKKYGLVKLSNKPHFLRMRPANFPTIRLAQLAMLVHHSSHLFSLIKEKTTVSELQKLFNITANDYWNYHYQLNDAPTNFMPKKLGNQMVNTIIINTIIPILFAYGLYSKDDNFKEKAIHFLQSLPAEKNNLTRQWELLKIENKNSFDSQALIELTNNYCKPKNCLNCAVGSKVLSLK